MQKARREYCGSDAAFYARRSIHGGTQASQVKRPKELEDEGRQLKHIMYAELSLDHRNLKVDVPDVVRLLDGGPILN